MQNLLSVPLFFQLLMFTIFIAFTLLSFDQGIQDLSFEIVLSINCMSCQTLFNYVVLNHAHNLSLHSSTTANIGNVSRWYTPNIKQQKLILIIIQRSQVPFFLYGYNIFHCSMIYFEGVILLKKFSNFKCVFFPLFRSIEFSILHFSWWRNISHFFCCSGDWEVSFDSAKIFMH